MSQDKFLQGYDPQVEWNKRARTPGPQSVMALDWSDDQCQQATKDLQAVILEILKPLAAEKILEIGCGIGRITQILSPFCDLTSIDISPEMIKRAALNISGRFCLASAFNLPFPDDIFDAVFEVTTFQHIVKEEGFELALKEMKRVVRPGGRIIICDEMTTGKREQPSPYRIIRNPRDYLNLLPGVCLVRIRRFLCVDDNYILMRLKKR